MNDRDSLEGAKVNCLTSAGDLVERPREVLKIAQG